MKLGALGLGAVGNVEVQAEFYCRIIREWMFSVGFAVYINILCAGLQDFMRFWKSLATRRHAMSCLFQWKSCCMKENIAFVFWIESFVVSNNLPNVQHQVSSPVAKYLPCFCISSEKSMKYRHNYNKIYAIKKLQTILNCSEHYLSEKLKIIGKTQDFKYGLYRWSCKFRINKLNFHPVYLMSYIQSRHKILQIPQ